MDFDYMTTYGISCSSHIQQLYELPHR